MTSPSLQKNDYIHSVLTIVHVPNLRLALLQVRRQVLR